MVSLMPHGMEGTPGLEGVCSHTWEVSFGVLPPCWDPELAGGFIAL